MATTILVEWKNGLGVKLVDGQLVSFYHRPWSGMELKGGGLPVPSDRIWIYPDEEGGAEVIAAIRFPLYLF